MAKLIMARQDVDMDAKNATGRMAHSIAAESGNLDVAKLFLADPWVDENSRDVDGRMPLSLADEHGRDEVVKLLLDPGAVDVEDYHGRTALSWANKEDKGIVKALREHAGRRGSERGSQEWPEPTPGPGEKSQEVVFGGEHEVAASSWDLFRGHGGAALGQLPPRRAPAQPYHPLVNMEENERQVSHSVSSSLAKISSPTLGMDGTTCVCLTPPPGGAAGRVVLQRMRHNLKEDGSCLHIFEDLRLNDFEDICRQLLV
jgi:hypothetical protein